MSLERYWKKRDFEKTPEPRGHVGKAQPRARFFCVQKHAASHLHYDFRLELDGVLKSWAVPKGPSLDPERTRLAMEVEDHPIEYGEFEGVIPEGEYGGGTVLLWDRGVWAPIEEEPDAALRKGKLHFVLRGEKLRGGFILVRTSRGEERPRWMLRKLADQEAANDVDITEERPESVATGRDIDAIARQKKRVWRSNRGGRVGGEEAGAAKKRRAPPRTVALIEPRAATKPPKGWLHEIAIEGLHVLARIEDGVVTLNAARTDVTRRFPHIARALGGLDVDDALIELWIADLDADGTTKPPYANPIAFANDLLYAGVDLRKKSLSARKAKLEALVRKSTVVRYVPHFEGEDVFERACALGAHAVLSRKDAPHGAKPVRIACAAKPKKDRVLWRAEDLHKSDLADYYRAIAAHVLPHVQGRPLTLVRANDAVEDGTIYLRHAKAWGSSSLRRIRIREKTKVGEYMVIDDIDGIVALVHMGVVEIHTWNSVAPNVDAPDRIVFDLDPDPSVPFSDVVDAARLLRHELKEVGLTAFVKTTGGKGLHVVVPLLPTTWDESFAFSRAFAEAIVRREPKRFTAQMAIAKRKGKIFIDYLRNNRGSTSVAAFSSRARAGATVSMPVTWAELGKVDPSAFTVKTVPAILSRKKRAAWLGYEEARAALPKDWTRSS